MDFLGRCSGAEQVAGETARITILRPMPAAKRRPGTDWRLLHDDEARPLEVLDQAACDDRSPT
jgi:hypothetical protein